MQHLDQLLARLIHAEVEFVLVGGLAAAIHGSSMQTRDVDICFRFSEANLMRISCALLDINPVHRLTPNLPLEVTPQLCAGLKNLYLKTDLGVLDCLSNVRGIGDYEEVFQHSIEIAMPFGRMRILNLDTLILAKKAMGRPHDLLTVQHLCALRALTPPPEDH